MGGGFTLATGAIISEQLNAIIEKASLEKQIPYQKNVVGRDTGTDGMAAFFASVDAASTSIGFPIRNMHTISETGHTGDVLASIYAVEAALTSMEQAHMSAEDFKQGHPRLDQVGRIMPVDISAVDDTSQER